MDLGPLRTLALRINLSTHGVAAVVTRPVPDETPIETRAIWVSPTDDTQPVGADFRHREPRRVLAIPRADVSTIPSGTVIEATPPEGGSSVTWRFEGHARPAEFGYWLATVKAQRA